MATPFFSKTQENGSNCNAAGDPGQHAPGLVSRLFRNVLFLTSLEVSLFALVLISELLPFWFAFRFCLFVFWFLFLGSLLVVGLALREALRSPKGGAFRAKRRARPTTAPSLSFPSSGSLKVQQRNCFENQPIRLPSPPRDRRSWGILARVFWQLLSLSSVGLPTRSPLRPRTGRLPPRVVGRRYPLPLGDA